MSFLLAAQGLFGIYTIRHTGMLYEDQTTALRELFDLKESLNELRLKVFHFLGTNNPEKMDHLKLEIDRIAEGLGSSLSTQPLRKSGRLGDP